MHRSNYSRVEAGDRYLSLDAVNKIARYFGMTIEELVNFDGNIPDEVTIEDTSLMEQVKLIAELPYLKVLTKKYLNKASPATWPLPKNVHQTFLDGRSSEASLT